LRKTAVKARKNAQVPEEEKEKIEDSLRRMENRLVERKRKEREQGAMKEWKKEEKEKRQQGKGAFYLKEGQSLNFFLLPSGGPLSRNRC
jgi:ribosomal RNA-processing protein 36